MPRLALTEGNEGNKDSDLRIIFPFPLFPSVNPIETSSEVHRMPNDVAVRRTIAHRPLRTSRAAGPTRVESQSGDREKDVSATRVDVDPFSLAAFAIPPTG